MKRQQIYVVDVPCTTPYPIALRLLLLASVPYTVSCTACITYKVVNLIKTTRVGVGCICRWWISQPCKDLQRPTLCGKLLATSSTAFVTTALVNIIKIIAVLLVHSPSY